MPGAERSGAGLGPACAGGAFGYFLDPQGEIFVSCPLEHGCDVDPARDTVYLAGDFNGWQAAVGEDEWQLQPAELDGERVLLWTGDAARFLRSAGLRFKFVTGEHQWLVPPDDAPNVVRDEQRQLQPLPRSARAPGWHLWQFTLAAPLDLAEPRTVTWADARRPASRPGGAARAGKFFLRAEDRSAAGALVRGRETVFRLFAPRARQVDAAARPDRPTHGAACRRFPLARRPDADGAAGVWEIALDRNLHGWFYWYIGRWRARRVRGGSIRHMRVLDPYALATVGRDGPGIVLDRAWVGQGDRTFQTPAWHDLSSPKRMCAISRRNAPVKATPEERRGFAGLRKWVESPDFYLHHLGVNCVELQPVQEFDNRTPEEYHWGYMTNNFFAPESSYALAPEKASGVRELQDLVAAFHRRGMAVVLDVVFNHVGEPAHLMFIDRLYYFEQDAAGQLANWSGCGNDLRARSAMARRLIIDSCVHLIEAYGVDGFRFDLAELLGVDVLRDIETALKRVKPDVILIAEPWSFRGHIAGALRDTGWASWNDGYRDFVRDYVRGNGTRGADGIFPARVRRGISRNGRRRRSTTPSRTTTGPGST